MSFPRCDLAENYSKEACRILVDLVSRSVSVAVCPGPDDSGSALLISVFRIRDDAFRHSDHLSFLIGLRVPLTRTLIHRVATRRGSSLFEVTALLCI